jgi:superfamily II DNA or RNA helicase
VSATHPPQLHHGNLVRIRGERWRIDHYATYDTVAVVEVTGCGATNRSERTRFLLPFELVDRLHGSSSPRLVSRARWRHIARHTLANASPSWSSLRAATHANLTLFPFQLEPAMALARGDGCRFLIADAVGLGKTVEAALMIAEVVHRRPDAKAMVICPAGLREQWKEELRTRFNLDAAIFDAGRLARAATQLPADVNPWAVEPIVIASIDYIKRPEVMRSLETLIWDVVVLDEAHHLAGRSDRAAAGSMLGDRARALVLLTATPHSGDDQAFARLCSLGSAGSSEPLITFRRTRAAAGGHVARRVPLLRVRPTHAETAMHAALMTYTRLVWSQSPQTGLSGARLAMSVLARRACSSAGSLARSVERRLTLMNDESALPGMQPGLPFDDPGVDDDEPNTALSSAGLHDRADERRRLEHLLDLARTAAAAESKLHALKRLLSRAREPAIVFTEYRDTLERIGSALTHVKSVQLHGGLTPHQRADALRRFTRGDARLLLATDAASEGLNLHHRCRLVVNLELPWTPLRLEQRAGRIDRIGQERRVHAVHLVAAGTCEEVTVARLVSRINRMHGAMTALTRMPDEERVAESILGRHSPPELFDDSPSNPSGIITIDLRDEALEESRRLSRSRAFAAASAHVHVPERSVISHVPRHRTNNPPHCLWVYRFVLTSSEGRLVWEALVPFAGTLTARRRYSIRLMRTLLNTDLPALQTVLANHCTLVLQQLRPSIRPMLARYSAREHSLASVLRSRHARLAAALLQRGLFDRRDEHLASAQTSLLEEALSQSASRLRELAAFDNLRIDAAELVFALLLE